MVGVLVIGILLAVYAALGLMTYINHYELATINQERQFLEQESSQYLHYQDLKNQVTAIESLANKAMGTTPSWSHLLHQINEKMAADIWLSELRANYEHNTTSTQEPGEFIIRGWTFDHPAVAWWLHEVQTVEGLDGVTCTFARRGFFGGREMINFEIKSDLLPGSEFQAGNQKEAEQ